MLERNKRAMRELIRRTVPETKQYFEDYVCDDGMDMGPYKIACTMWREGDKCIFDFAGTDPQSVSSINFLLNEEMFKMFAGVYMIMVFDPQILFNDGFYDLMEVRIPEGTLLKPLKPAALSCRTHALGRIFDVLGGLLGQGNPAFMCAAGFSDSPHFMYSGYDKDGEWYQLYQIGFGGIPGKPFGDGPDGHSLWPSFTNVPNEFLESYFPLRIDTYETITDSGGAGQVPRRQRHPHRLPLPRAGRDLDPRRSLAHLSLGRQRRTARRSRSRKLLQRADGSEELLPSKMRSREGRGRATCCCTRPGAAAAAAIRSSASPAKVAFDVEAGLVSDEGARRYGVVLKNGRVRREGDGGRCAPRWPPKRGARAALRPRLQGHRGAEVALQGRDRARTAGRAAVPGPRRGAQARRGGARLMRTMQVQGRGAVRAVDKAYEAVRSGIIAGRYLAGARLTEQEIATTVGVSRTPVREALRRLDAEGLVEFTPNLGAVVTIWSEADSDEVFDLRAMLESYSARRATLRAAPEQIAELRRLAETQYRESVERKARPSRAHRGPEQPVPSPPAGSAPRARGSSRALAGADRGAADDAHLPEVHARGSRSAAPSITSRSCARSRRATRNGRRLVMLSHIHARARCAEPLTQMSGEDRAGAGEPDARARREACAPRRRFRRAYLQPDSPLYAGVETARAAAAATLLGLARRAGIPVMHTNVVYEPGGADGGVFFRKLPALASFERGKHPELAAFAEGLEPLPGEPVFSKQYASAFFGTQARDGAARARRGHAS